MSEHKRIIKNTGILMGMELGTGILEVLVSVILARYLAPKGYGLMAFALAFVSLFSILPGFGMGTLITRDLARDPSAMSRYLSNGLVATVGLSILTLVIIFFTGLGLGFSFEKEMVVSIAALLMILEIALRFTTAFFRAQQAMTTVAMLNLVLSVGWMSATLLVVWQKGSLIEVLGVRALISVAIVAFSFWLINTRLERLSWNFSWPFLWKMLKASLPFALFQLFVRVYVKVDMVMISFMRGDVVTGWYAVSQKFRQALSFIPLSVSGAIMPAMSKVSKQPSRNMAETLTKSCKFLMIIALPIAGGITIIADRLVFLMYGPAYQASVPALRIVIWTILFAFLNSSLSSALLALNKEKEVGWALGVGALSNILTNLIAIPLWAHVGAASTTVLSEALVFGIQIYLLRRYLPEARPLNQIVPLTGATFLMMIFAWFTHRSPLFYTIAGSVSVYVLFLLMAGIVDPEERAFIRGIFQRKKVQNL